MDKRKWQTSAPVVSRSGLWYSAKEFGAALGVRNGDNGDGAAGESPRRRWTEAGLDTCHPLVVDGRPHRRGGRRGTRGGHARTASTTLQSMSDEQDEHL